MTTKAQAFTHKPKGLLTEQFFHPIHTKKLWDEVWSKARKQDWFEDGVECVGNKDGYFYFQLRRLTTGFARIKV